MEHIDGSQPLYEQLAAKLREQIAQGRPGPGQSLPEEATLGAVHGVGRTTVRRALAVLRDEGIISKKRGALAIVRPLTARRPMTMPTGSRLHARMPTQPERSLLGIERGTPVVQFQTEDGSIEVIPADLVEVVQPPCPS